MLNPDVVKKYHFISYIENEDFKIWTTNFKTNNKFNFEYFLENGKFHITLWTFNRFVQPSCRSWTKTFVNRFSKIDGRWENGNFEVEKFKNFNGCQLVFRVQGIGPPLNTAVIANRKLIRMIGIGPKTIETISKHLNFTLKYDPFHGDKSLIGQNLPFDLQLMMASMRQRSGVKNGGVFTFPFHKIDGIFMISRNGPYTPFEKNFIPFEAEVWLWLIATLLFIAASIAITNFAPTHVFKFIFGSKVSSPSLNMM